VKPPCMKTLPALRRIMQTEYPVVAESQRVVFKAKRDSMYRTEMNSVLPAMLIVSPDNVRRVEYDTNTAHRGSVSWHVPTGINATNNVTSRQGSHQMMSI